MLFSYLLINNDWISIWIVGRAADLLLLRQRGDVESLQQQKLVDDDASDVAGWFHRSGSQSPLRQHVGHSSAGTAFNSGGAHPHPAASAPLQQFAARSSAASAASASSASSAQTLPPDVETLLPTRMYINKYISN